VTALHEAAEAGEFRAGEPLYSDEQADD